MFLSQFYDSEKIWYPHIREIVKSGFLDVSANFKIWKHFGTPT